VRKLTLVRRETSDEGTFGILLLDNIKYYTLERPWRDNKPYVSCIPRGEYTGVWTYSPKYDKNMYIVMGDHGREGIRIHSANWAGDDEKGWQSQLLGCIALGRSRGRLAYKGGPAQKAIIASRMAIREFEETLNGETFELEIRDETEDE